MMSHKFIKDPRELVKAGDVVKVKVLEVDLQRKRIALTMKLDEARSGQPPARGRPSESQPGSRGASPPRGRDSQHRGSREQDRRPPASRPADGRPKKSHEPDSNSNGVMAEALARAFKR
jgi:protein Tex